MPKESECTLPSDHAQLVIDKFFQGCVVPFLGAGVNLCDRPEGFKWGSSEGRYLPNGRELARELADGFHYPDVAQVCKAPADLCLRPNPELDLARVSQYGDLHEGKGPLYAMLRSIFTREFQLTTVHKFLADLPSAKPEPGRPENRNLLVVTTNYDDLMERALVVRQPCDVVFYDPDPAEDKLPRFWHKKPDGTLVEIVDPSTYNYQFFDERPVVLKIHGTIDRSPKGHEGFVITEDHYIEYLAREPLEKLLPPDFLTKLRCNHLLFLGYSLRDWNLRVFLRHLKRSPKERYKPWAVLPHADPVEEPFWEQQGIGIMRATLKTYIDALQGELAARCAQSTPAVAASSTPHV